MAAVLERAKLARLAARLNARNGPRAWPSLLLVTDDLRLSDPLSAARGLPPGSGIIVRARDARTRGRLARELSAQGSGKDFLLFIADDPALALAIGAEGVHLPEVKVAQAAQLRSTSNLLITAATHSARAVMRAKLCGADAALLSPVFPTESHKAGASLSPVRASLIARGSNFPVYALGGVTARNAASLSGFVGIAAIGALKA